MIGSAPGLNIDGAPFCTSCGSKYSPLLNTLVSTLLIKVLKPSSIQAYLRSFEPTIIGNQLWPNSWLVTSHRSPVCDFHPQKTIPGYSIPPTIPATLVATG